MSLCVSYPNLCLNTKIKTVIVIKKLGYPFVFNFGMILIRKKIISSWNCIRKPMRTCFAITY